MPHLSPMNWLFALWSFWIMISLINSSNWWSQPNTFFVPKSGSTKSSFNNWNWSL